MAWRLLLAAAVVAQLVALYWPVQLDEGSLVPGSDKIVHVAIFAGATFTALLSGVPRWWVLALFLVHAPVSEAIQGSMTSRDPSAYDVVADVVGVLCGAWLAGAIGARLGREPRPVVAGTPVSRED